MALAERAPTEGHDPHGGSGPAGAGTVERPRFRRSVAVLRIALLLLVVLMVGPLLLSLLDTRGPVGYSLYDVTTSVNPLAPGSTLTVRTGDTVRTAPLLPQTEAGVQQIDGIEWRLGQSVTLTYTPEPSSDEPFTATFDLRDAGANLLARGRFVRADLVISDEAARLVISQPTVRGLTIERRILHEVTLERTRPATPVREATCFEIEARRWRASPLEANLHERFREVFASVTGVSYWSFDASTGTRRSWQDRYHPGLVEGIEENGQRLSEVLGARGFFTSRPSGSELAARIEALQRDNAALAEAFRGRTGWTWIGTETVPVGPGTTRTTIVRYPIGELQATLQRSTWDLGQDWIRLVEQDARAICAMRDDQPQR
jgi:hypothetical protein